MSSEQGPVEVIKSPGSGRRSSDELGSYGIFAVTSKPSTPSRLNPTREQLRNMLFAGGESGETSAQTSTAQTHEERLSKIEKIGNQLASALSVMKPQ